MQTALAESLQHRADAAEAASILRACVHCGLCLASCPTYQLRGDELDSPRGRIYLTKQLLEGGAASARTRLHLDRCLSCGACESACPSGVRYGRLLEIGRSVLDSRSARPLRQVLARYLLRKLIPHRRRVRVLLMVARMARPLLPQRLRAHVPRRRRRAGSSAWPAPRHARRVLLLEGCAQAALAPEINVAAARVLDTLGISALRVPQAGCCGALTHHLGAEEETRAQLRRNVDVLEPLLDERVEAVLSASSACSAVLTQYGRLLAAEPGYAARAARIATLALDLSEVVAAEGDALRRELPPGRGAGVRVAFQSPCTLQHALQSAGKVEPLLRAAGYELTAVADEGRCCGAAGTYFLLQGELSVQLRDAKLAALQAGEPALLATANIGCLQQLRSAATLPVRHWIELLAARLDRG
ncbi:MAG: glycolate oxidase subunit GlcF [Gammaproteobacteria bacterium]|nr:glycolate oxidase subunit GlcF [Gammaproteobacteria bacterium]MBV9619793.1 glycolate oxidase subunit GlcF [Gammaproteobacteria bacterium]